MHAYNIIYIYTSIYIYAYILCNALCGCLLQRPAAGDLMRFSCSNSGALSRSRPAGRPVGRSVGRAVGQGGRSVRRAASGALRSCVIVELGDGS